MGPPPQLSGWCDLFELGLRRRVCCILRSHGMQVYVWFKFSFLSTLCSKSRWDLLWTVRILRGINGRLSENGARKTRVSLEMLICVGIFNRPNSELNFLIEQLVQDFSELNFLISLLVQNFLAFSYHIDLSHWTFRAKLQHVELLHWTFGLNYWTFVDAKLQCIELLHQKFNAKVQCIELFIELLIKSSMHWTFALNF